MRNRDLSARNQKGWDASASQPFSLRFRFNAPGLINPFEVVDVHRVRRAADHEVAVGAVEQEMTMLYLPVGRACVS